MTGVDGHALKIGDGWCTQQDDVGRGGGKDFCPAASPLGESTGYLGLGKDVRRYCLKAVRTIRYDDGVL
jgi:hypothetical protein